MPMRSDSCGEITALFLALPATADVLWVTQYAFHCCEPLWLSDWHASAHKKLISVSCYIDLHPFPQLKTADHPRDSDMTREINLPGNERLENIIF